MEISGSDGIDVDQDRRTCAVHCRMLKREGVRVVHAPDVQAAKHALHNSARYYIPLPSPHPSPPFPLAPSSWVSESPEWSSEEANGPQLVHPIRFPASRAPFQQQL